nr:hypothetical protein [Tanacetum cinerariifolium]
MPEDPYAYVVAAFQALPPPDYVPGPEEPEQAPPSLVYIPYVPEPVYPEYIPAEDDVFPVEEQPLPTAASPTADLPGYIPEPDLDEDLEDDDEDSEEDPADYPADYDDDEEEEEPSGDDADEENEEQDEDDDDDEEEHPASADSIPPPPALHRLEVTLPPRKRLNIVHCPRYEAGESSVAFAARPMEGRRADYGFIDSVEAKIRRQRAEDIRYGIRDTWIDPRDVAEEEALTTLEGVNTRVTELAAVQEHDTQDIYGMMEDSGYYYVGLRGFHEYIPLEDDVFPAEEQLLPAAASPTTDSPGYIPESDPDEDPKDDDDEDPKEDPADYLADHDDDEEEEPFRDDANEEDDEQDKDNDDEEEEHPASADSIPPPPALPSPPILPILLPAASPPLQLLSSDRKADRPEVTLPPRKRLNIVHCPGYELGESSVVAAARPMEGRKADYGFVDHVEAEIRRRRAENIEYGIRDIWIDPRDVAEEVALTTLEGVNTRVTELAALQEQDTQDIYGVMEDTQGRQAEIFQRVEALVDDRQYHYETGRLDQRIDAQDTLIATLTTQLSSLQGHLATALGEIRVLQAREQARAGAPEANGCYLSCDLKKMAPKKAAPKRTTRLNLGATPNTNSAPSTTTITVTNAQLQAMVDQGVNTALAVRDANRTGDDSYTSGTGVRRIERVTRECTYQDFMKCQPLYFKGTEGVVELTQWFERMEMVFRISNCLADNQIKFATCTLLAGALTWWNSHARIVGNDAAYVMT